MSPSERDALPELDERVRRLLAAYARENGMPADVRARMDARLRRDVRGAMRRSRDRRSLVAGIMLAMAAAFVLVIAWGFGLRRGRLGADERMDTQAEHLARDRDPRPTEIRSVGDMDPPQAVVAPPTVVEPSAVSLPESSPAPFRPRRAPRGVQGRAEIDSPAVEERSRPDGFAEELALTKAAQSAVNAGEHDRALELVDELERRFPTGRLVQERSAIRVLALCGSGNLRQGKAEAERFLRLHPRSVMAARVRDGCRNHEP